MSAQRPIMIGAHTPKRPQPRRRAVQLTLSSREFNAAYDAWARRQGRTHLSYQRKAFGEV